MTSTVRINAYSTLRGELRPADVDHLVTRCLRDDDRVDPAVVEHLDAMRAYVGRDCSPNPTLTALQDHVDHVWWHYVIDATPEQAQSLGDWAEATNAVAFGPDGLVDPAGLALLPADGTAVGQVPVTPEARDRADRQQSWLASHGVRIPAAGLPVRSSGEVLARPAEQVALRALGVTLSSYFAGAVMSVPASQLNAVDMRHDYPRAFAALTAREQDLFRDRDRDLADRLQWTIAEAETLLWSLGRLPGRLPTALPQASDVLAAAFGIPEGEFTAQARLRPVAELLDEWQRMDTLSRADAGPLRSDVVAARCRTLRWLFDPRLVDWDDALPAAR